ncbi:MAG: anti-virulence regulator CigR family protein [Alphaproteobacteria bacterium]|nr:anti-virulence regulator CigR family protein [Alphaproteobacteria bacterium]
MPHRPLILAISLVAALAAPALAKNDKASGNASASSKGKPAHAEKAGDRNTTSSGSSKDVDAAVAAGAVLAGVLLSDADKATVARYFQDNPQPTTALPPGIAKNLARGKPLPPGIAKKTVPGALAGQLSIPKGYELQTVGANVMLVQIGTRIVADIIKDVLGD